MIDSGIDAAIRTSGAASRGSSPSSAVTWRDDRRPRHVRRRRDRGEPVQRHRDRRPRVQREAADREGRRAGLQRLAPAEVEAIRWAVDHGARVINLIGGLRDPRDPSSTRTRRSSRPRSSTRTRRACSSSRRSATGRSRPRRRGSSPTTRPRCRTCSASARSRRTARPGLLESRRAVRRHRGAGRADLLDDPAEPRRRPRRLRRTGRTPTAALRSSATGSGRRSPRRRSPLPRRCCSASTRSSRPTRSSGCSSERADDEPVAPAARVPGRAATRYTAGAPSTSPRRSTVLGDGTTCRRPTRYEPNDDAGASSHALLGPPRTITATLDYWDDPSTSTAITLKRGQSSSPV